LAKIGDKVFLNSHIPLRRLRCRQEDIIRIDLKEIAWEGVD
jgi:hypothetical protein